MVRFSTTICSGESQPSSKRLKTSIRSDGNGIHAENSGRASSLASLDFLASTSSSTNIPNVSLSSPSSNTSSTAVFLDLDTLDCSVCMENLSAPIFQCSNGHYACSECTKRLYKCPSCMEPVGKIRNLGLEKILESLKVLCKFYDHGCPHGLLPYTTKKIHEQRCLFSSRDCPLKNCTFNGPLAHFKAHFMDCHNAKTLSFRYDVLFTMLLSVDDSYVLLHGDDDTFFLFKVHNQAFGKAVYVSSLLSSDLDDMFSYQLEVKLNQSHLTLVSVVQTHGYEEVNLDSMNFLLVPGCYFRNESFQVEVTIKHRM